MTGVVVTSSIPLPRKPPKKKSITLHSASQYANN
jgi:hypothetical protein